MIKRLIWTIWTPMSSVLKKADKLNLSLSLSSSEAGTGHPATVSSTTVSFCRARLTRPWWGSLAAFPWVLFFIGPQRGTAGVSVWVLILGLPSVPALWVWTHLDTERRIGLGSPPWFPGVSLPSCAKPNKLLKQSRVLSVVPKGPWTECIKS